MSQGSGLGCGSWLALSWSPRRAITSVSPAVGLASIIARLERHRTPSALPGGGGEAYAAPRQSGSWLGLGCGSGSG